MELEYPPGIQVPNTTNWVFVDSNEGKLITLNVWNTKLQAFRGSPADSAGLVPYGDYVIGWRGGPLETESDFVQLVEHHANQHLALYVYNTDYDHTREVVIVPNRDWGGEGLLGCGIGSGLLHRIPKPQRTFEDSEEFAAAPPLVYEPRGQPRAQISAAQNARPEASMPSNLTGVTVSMHAQEEE
ncbi:hypothetical protein MVES1_002021 [Malassezia vespertilionis]|uniref:uncharacterized protein n=1 Tax=Malassezia vespertilionis TaxID=2020962 RepID=UPI0024B071C5|nr:uncharacterized protein MVES1_002021 [Malassezia vespertilionis]WFD06667.1 hypothetical protein MVES1_002021 [Malassezia vespertilionis]